MKRPTRTLAQTALLLLLVSGQHASACYDPAMQRWINRDPSDEKRMVLGSLLTASERALSGHLQFGMMASARPVGFVGDCNAYIFNYNEPVSLIDRDGQLPIEGPSPMPGYLGPQFGTWPKLPKCVSDCAAKCGLASLPMRGTCALGCIAAGPAYLECFTPCMLASTVSQALCTSICLLGKLL